VTDEAYLYTLILYIENNPVKAGIVTVPEAYPYSSANYLLAHKIPECLKNSWVAQNFENESKEAMMEFLHSQPDSDQLNEMKKAASLVEAPNTEKKRSEEKLRSILQKARDKRERNALILQCYEQGYSQHLIAKVLEISQPAVNGIIRRGR
jgi:DNA-directed RNA polymerase specialized sigma subunit